MRCFYVLQKAAKAGEGGDTVMTQTFMKEKKILPLVLSMSLPMVISMAVNSLYNIVDSYFVAKLSEEAMTALALVYPSRYTSDDLLHWRDAAVCTDVFV